MPLCPSGILVSALALSLILADIYHSRINYIAEHTILGGAMCILFFTMCNYGYEMINWFVLAVIPIYIFLRWFFSEPSSENENENEECDMCRKPKKTCGCPEREPKKEPSCKPKLGCPAKPISLGTLCGISRFT